MDHFSISDMKSIKILITGEDEAGQNMISEMISEIIEQKGYIVNQLKTTGTCINFRAWGFIEDFDVDIISIRSGMNIEDQVITLTKFK